MNVEELEFINSKVNIISRKRMFTDMMNNIGKGRRQDSTVRENKEERTFIEELDERTKKSEKLKDTLKGNAFYLEPKKVHKDNHKGKRNQTNPKAKVKFNLFRTENRKNNTSNDNLITEEHMVTHGANTGNVLSPSSHFGKEESKISERLQFLRKNSILKFTSPKKQSEKNLLIERKKSITNINAITNTNQNNYNISIANLSASNMLQFDLSTIGSPKQAGLHEDSELHFKPGDHTQRKSKTVDSDMFLTDLAGNPNLNMVSRELEKIEENKRDKIKDALSANAGSLFNKRRNTLKVIHSQLIESGVHTVNLIPEFNHVSKNLHTALYDPLDGERRLAFSLNDNKEIFKFVDAIITKTDKKLKYKYPLIPPVKIDSVIKIGSTLNKIYSKCVREVKIAEEVEKLMIREKRKEVSNSQTEKDNKIKNLQSQQDVFLYDDDKKDKQKEDKIFIYNNNNRGSGEFVSNNAENINRIDYVDKLSENLAFLNRDDLMKRLGYNYNKDPEFIFKEETMKNQKNEDMKKMVIEKKKRREKDKHDVVENILEKTIKRKKGLMERVNSDIITIIPVAQGKYDIDENYHIDFLNKRSPKNTNKNTNKYGSSPNKNFVKSRNRSMANIRSKNNILPMI